MRIRPWHVLIIIILLTLGSGWISLPGQALDVSGIKDSVTVHQGLDLQGGVQVVLEARPAAGQKVDKGTLDGTRDTIERRVNGLGVSEPLIQTRGSNQILVELPGAKDAEEAVRVLQQTALLEIIDPQGSYLAPGTVVDTNLGTAASLNSAATPAVGTPDSVTGRLSRRGATPSCDLRSLHLSTSSFLRRPPVRSTPPS